ncbi:MFS transporter [Isoptericola cucumis]|uniref:MFS transporter n=2 Tax=Isoptericola cucumis TaxID=1776856 RepID=A0ABQ2B772_9MICO|nr:MFS transporter [Isoptericola cucumis]GGI08287.1 MFS transporter [Isoptericola cucumis]
MPPTSTPVDEVAPDRTDPTITRHPARVTFALSMAVLAFSLMQTLVVPALPTLGRELGATAQGTGWILTAFLLAGAVLAPVVGNLGDRFGHRRVLLATILVFAAATLAAAAAPSLGVLLAARVVQGVSTATFPLALALARQVLAGPRLAAAFGWIPGMIGLGAGAALVVGGVVVDALSWRWLFVLGAVLILGSAVLVAAWVPRGGAPAVQRRTDWPGIALLAGGLVGVLLAVSQGGTWGWTSARTLGAGVAGLVLLALLVLVELRSPAPVVDVRTFRHGPIVLVSLLTVAVGFVPYVCYVALPLLMQAPAATGYGHGMSVTVSGLAMLPSAVLVFLGGRTTPVLVRRVGAGRTGAVAAAVMALGAAGLALWPATPWAVVVAFSVLGLGNGIGYAICAQLVVMSSPATETGAATGLNSVVRTVGSAAAAPVVTALLAAAGSAEPVGGYAAAFWVATAVSVVGVAVALVLAARTRRAG